MNCLLLKFQNLDEQFVTIVTVTPAPLSVLRFLLHKETISYCLNLSISRKNADCPCFVSSWPKLQSSHLLITDDFSAQMTSISSIDVHLWPKVEFGNEIF